MTILLDESCEHLEGAIKDRWPVRVFRRANGFRSESKAAAQELHQFLQAGDLLGQVVLVAASFAGFTALLVENEYPGALAGIVLVEPSHPRQGPEALRILADAPPSAELDQLRSLLGGFGPAWENSCREVAKIRSLGEIPLHVFAGGIFDIFPTLSDELKTRLVANRQAMLQEYCALSTRSTFQIVDTAGHDIAHQAPSVVVAAAEDVLTRAKAKTKPPSSVDGS